MANSSDLKEAANRLIEAARAFVDAVELEESNAAGSAAVPAHMVNVPPETRAARPDLAHTDPQTAKITAPDNKTAASDAISRASAESKKTS
jgi:hypothetical protein